MKASTGLYFDKTPTWGYGQSNSSTEQQTVERQQIPPPNAPYQPPNFSFQHPPQQHRVSRGQFAPQDGNFPPNGSQQPGGYPFPTFAPPNMTARLPQNDGFSPNGSQQPGGYPFPTFAPPNMTARLPQNGGFSPNGSQQPGGYPFPTFSPPNMTARLPQDGDFPPNGSQQPGGYPFQTFTPPNMTARPPQNGAFSPNRSQQPGGYPFPTFSPPNMTARPPQDNKHYTPSPPQWCFSPTCTPPSDSRSTTPITTLLTLPHNIDDLNQSIMTIAQEQGLVAARKFFDTFPDGMTHNLASYYNMLTAYIEHKDESPHIIHSLFNLMRRERITTDANFYRDVVPVCKKTRRREVAIHLAKKLRDDRVNPDIDTANTMLQILGDMRCDKEAYNVFERLNNRNANTFEIMYAMNIRTGYVQKIKTVNQFRRMQKIPTTKIMVQALTKNGVPLATLYQEEKNSGLLTEHLCYQMWENCVERQNGQNMLEVIHDMQENKLSISREWLDQTFDLFSKKSDLERLEQTIIVMHKKKITINCETLLTTYLTHKNLARYIEVVKKLISMGMATPTINITRTCFDDHLSRYAISELLDIFSQLKRIGITFDDRSETKISMKLRSGIETLSKTSLEESKALFEKACKLEFPISKYVLSAYFMVLKSNNKIDELNKLYKDFKDSVKYDRVIHDIVKVANNGEVTKAKTKERRR